MPSRQTSERNAPKDALDSRFASLTTDPRYRLPSRKQTHVKIDQRFAHMLRDDDFSAKATVDRYGRRLPKGSGNKKLQRMYRLDTSDDDHAADKVDDDDDVRKELDRVDRIYDPAREGGFSESSSSESDDDDDSSSSSDGDDDDDDEGERDAAADAGLDQHGMDDKGTLDVPMGQVSSRLAAVNLDWDNIRAVDLMAVAHSFCPPDGRILNVSIYPSDFGKERMEREELEGPPKELFISKKSKSKKEPVVTIPSPDSDFQHEHSPSPVASDDDDRIQKSLLAHASAPQPEIDTKALRTYQLSRLRYYYAIITCSSDSAAHTLYNSMDGREYLSTANFFDLRFVPEDVDFDEKPKDVCERLPEGYRPQEFVTDALTHSKVRLTWDEEDQGRKDAQKRAFGTGEWGKGKGRGSELDDNDLKAYVGSDSESSEADDDQIGGVAVDGVRDTPSGEKLSKAEQARRKMRELLGLSVNSAPTGQKSKATKSSTKSTAAPSGNMQITFSAGLSSAPDKSSAKTPSSVFQNKPSDAHEETTREKYIRKEKERKARRKTKTKSAAAGDDEDNDGFQNPAAAASSKAADVSDNENGQQDPFDDPFFADPASANAAARKAAKRAKKEEAAAEAAAAAAKRDRERAQLELLMDDDDGARGGLAGSGFDMAAIQKSEKEAARKGRKGRQRKGEKEKGARELERGDDFEMDVEDPRFAGVFENHEFAIDPSSSRFSGTKGMKRLLEEGRKKRRGVADADGFDDRDGRALSSKGKSTGAELAAEGESGEVDELVRKIKRRKAA